MRIRSITSKILLLTVVTILAGSGLVVIYFLNAQNRDLLRERETSAARQADVLFESIKNNMLVGTAPIARSLLQDLKSVSGIREIALFRANGQEAFSDDQTIRSVTQWMEEAASATPYAPYSTGGDYGYSTPPTPPPAPPLAFTAEYTYSGTYMTDDSGPFQAAVRVRQPQLETRLTEHGRELVYYMPLLNAEACQRCHAPHLSPDPQVRGVIRVGMPLDDVDRSLRRNTLAAAAIWTTTVVVLTIAVTRGMEQLVLRPLRAIGETAREVERGNLDARAPVHAEDEIGTLGRQINQMIVGLNERLKLTKFVSRATLEEIAASKTLSLGGEKRELTVLFSDIRGFTTFAEQRDPQDVIATLNLYMQRQAAIILKAGGDVDQFVGDEILGVFESGEQAVAAALDIVAALDELNAARGLNLHVGIGIHTGAMITGNIGAQGDVERLQRTVIGDAVNLGSRICSIAAPGEVLISEDTYALLKEQLVVSAARTVAVKGKSQPVTVYSVVGFKGRE